MEKHENPHGVLNRIHVLGKHHPAFALGADAEAEISKLLTDMLAAEDFTITALARLGK